MAWSSSPVYRGPYSASSVTAQVRLSKIPARLPVRKILARNLWHIADDYNIFGVDRLSGCREIEGASFDSIPVDDDRLIVMKV